MKKFFTFGVCFAVLSSLYAGDQLEMWYQGSVVLRNQHVVVGNISVYQEHDLIVFRTDADTSTTILPAYKIESVFFYDSSANINRKYISRVNQHASFPHYQLFEVVLAGSIPVLRKQGVWSSDSEDAKCFNYYILYENDILELRKFRRLVYPHIVKQSKEILMFVRREKLSPNKADSAVKIIRHYNLQGIHAALAVN